MRPFIIPEPFLSDVNAAVAQAAAAREQAIAEGDPKREIPSLVTPVMKRYEGRIGDYDLARRWYRQLAQEFNWAGPTMNFASWLEYFNRQAAGSDRHRQMVYEQNGEPAAIARYLHLSQDTPTRRRDNTKVEETLFADPASLRDPDLEVVRFMFDQIGADSVAAGRSRVVTEYGVGVSPQRFRSLARTVKTLSQRDELNDDDAAALVRATTLLNKDWVRATVAFAEKLGFAPSDIMIPHNREGSAVAQMRVSRVFGDGALPMPDYQSKAGTCYAVTHDDDLAPLRAFMADSRAAALERTGLAALL